MDLATLALLTGAAATWAMVGVIWVMQLVHYPLLVQHSALHPRVAAQDHQRRITPIVGVLMGLEVVTALILIIDRPPGVSAVLAWLAAGLLAFALLTTGLVQVPLHGRLADDHDDDAGRRLVAGNWIRTVAWTARALVLGAAVWGALGQ